MITAEVYNFQVKLLVIGETWHKLLWVSAIIRVFMWDHLQQQSVSHALSALSLPYSFKKKKHVQNRATLIHTTCIKLVLESDVNTLSSIINLAA